MEMNQKRPIYVILVLSLLIRPILAIDIILLKKCVLTSPGATTLGFDRDPGAV